MFLDVLTLVSDNQGVTKEPRLSPQVANGGNPLKMLVAFAAWRPCDACGVLVLFVDGNLRTDTPCICPRCGERLACLRNFLGATALLSVAASFLLAVLP